MSVMIVENARSLGRKNGSHRELDLAEEAPAEQRAAERHAVRMGLRLYCMLCGRSETVQRAPTSDEASVGPATGGSRIGAYSCPLSVLQPPCSTTQCARLPKLSMTRRSCAGRNPATRRKTPMRSSRWEESSRCARACQKGHR